MLKCTVVDIEAWAGGGGYTFQVDREVRCVCSQYLNVSNVRDSLTTMGNSLQVQTQLPFLMFNSERRLNSMQILAHINSKQLAE